MNENLFEAQYDVTKKSKIKLFYEKNKILIISIILIVIMSVGSVSYFLKSNEKEKILLSENFIASKIYLLEGNKNKSLQLLKDIIFSNDSTYSLLSLFVILNEKLIDDQNEVSKLFDYVLENCKFEREVKNLVIFKKSLFESNFIDEEKLLEQLKPIINSESLWKPHALMLVGDYFISNKLNIKAKEFYEEILKINNLEKNLYEKARSQLVLISNE